MKIGTLFIFSGLPGSGKSTLSKELAKSKSAVFIRVDTIEQGLRDLCGIKVEGEGYRLSYQIAKDNLTLGMNVVADSVNPIELCRREWENVAFESGSRFINIQVICSDKAEHQKRVESRKNEIYGLVPPTWKDVIEREYHTWTVPILTIDTANRSISDCMEELLIKIDQTL